MSWGHILAGFGAGLGISVITAPVGISGAVFLLPFQLDVLHVPNPRVTPTNLLYNVVAGPGALLRYHRQRQLTGPLTRLLILGTLPGVVVGAVIRVFAASGADTFRLLAAGLLLPLGVWLLVRRPVKDDLGRSRLAPSRITGMALGVGVVGGIYGIGGGSILAPILVGNGIPLVVVAPAALASTLLTSITGAVTYALLALARSGTISPNWALGIACGLGGLFGGYLGAKLQPRLNEQFLRRGLGIVAIALAATYVLDVAL